jgi:LPXTG-motif cell wall-anchored protein
MRWKTKKTLVKVTAASLALVAAGAFVDGLVQPAGAAITDPVAPYLVGEVQVFGSTHRNPSCSVTRNVVNQADGARRVIMWITWDGHLEPVMPQPGTSAMDGDEVLAAGEASSVTFTNDGHISPTATGMRLHTLVLIPDGVAQVGAQVSEDIEPCRAETTPPSTPAPTVPPVEPTVPSTVPETVPVPVTDPPSVTVPVSDTTSPPPSVVSGPAPSTPSEPGVCAFDPEVGRHRDSATGQFCAGVEVLEQRVSRGELPNTGGSTGTLVVLGAGLLVTGASLMRSAGRLTHGEDAR